MKIIPEIKVAYSVWDKWEVDGMGYAVVEIQVEHYEPELYLLEHILKEN